MGLEQHEGEKIYLELCMNCAFKIPESSFRFPEVWVFPKDRIAVVRLSLQQESEHGNGVFSVRLGCICQHMWLWGLSVAASICVLAMTVTVNQAHLKLYRRVLYPLLTAALFLPSHKSASHGVPGQGESLKTVTGHPAALPAYEVSGFTAAP